MVGDRSDRGLLVPPDGSRNSDSSGRLRAIARHALGGRRRPCRRRNRRGPHGDDRRRPSLVGLGRPQGSHDSHRGRRQGLGSPRSSIRRDLPEHRNRVRPVDVRLRRGHGTRRDGTRERRCRRPLVVGSGDHVAPRDVDVVGQGDRHRHGRKRLVDRTVVGVDGGDGGLEPRREHHDVVARLQSPPATDPA